MRILKKISPDNGYCLYFPKRKTGNQVIIGEAIWVWGWEKWKHIKLGLVEVTLQDMGLIKTIDNLNCNVRAHCKVVIGGVEEGREERLKKATQAVPPTIDIDVKVESDFFHLWATNICKAAIRQVINDSEFAEILENPVVITRKIRSRLEENLEAFTGMILAEGEFDLEPLEPIGVNVPKSAIDAMRRTKKNLRDTTIADEELENDLEAEKERIHKNHEIAVNEIRNELETGKKELQDAKNQIENEIKREEQRHESELKEIKSEYEKLTIEYERQSIEGKVELDILKNENESKIEQQRKEYETELERLESDINVYKTDNAAKIKKINQETELAQLELQERQLKLDRVRSEIEALVNEGKDAARIKKLDMVLKALPSILEDNKGQLQNATANLDFINELVHLAGESDPETKKIVSVEVQKLLRKELSWKVDESHFTTPDTTYEINNGIEAYAVARCGEMINETATRLDQPLKLHTGLLGRLPEGFEGTPVVIPSITQQGTAFAIEISVYSEYMDIRPSRSQVFMFHHDRETDLLEFILTPRQLGPSIVEIEFYYQRHWLAQIQLQIEVVKDSESLALVTAR